MHESIIEIAMYNVVAKSIIIILALQYLVDLRLFQNCPQLYSVLRLTSPVSYAHVL